MTPDLAQRLKAHKADLLAVLSDDPVSQDDRQQVYAAMIDRVSATYRDGPIDWPRLDAISQRVWQAETMAELSRSIAAYESAALHRNNTGPIT